MFFPGVYMFHICNKKQGACGTFQHTNYRLYNIHQSFMNEAKKRVSFCHLSTIPTSDDWIIGQSEVSYCHQTNFPHRDTCGSGNDTNTCLTYMIHISPSSYNLSKIAISINVHGTSCTLIVECSPEIATSNWFIYKDL